MTQQVRAREDSSSNPQCLPRKLNMAIECLQPEHSAQQRKQGHWGLFAANLTQDSVRDSLSGVNERTVQDSQNPLLAAVYLGTST